MNAVNKKNAILFLGIVLICVVVIAVMNFLLNRQESNVSVERVDKQKADIVATQPVTQARPAIPEEEKKARPEYETTVSNGTILF